jgi:hypothetical protein
MSELSAILTPLKKSVLELKRLKYSYFFWAGGGAWKSLTGLALDSSICF